MRIWFISMSNFVSTDIFTEVFFLLRILSKVAWKGELENVCRENKRRSFASPLSTSPSSSSSSHHIKIIVIIISIVVNSKCEMKNVCCENKGRAWPALHQTFLLILPLSSSLLHTGHFLTWEPGKPEYKCVNRGGTNPWNWSRKRILLYFRKKFWQKYIHIKNNKWRKSS